MHRPRSRLGRGDRTVARGDGDFADGRARARRRARGPGCARCTAPRVVDGRPSPASTPAPRPTPRSPTAPGLRARGPHRRLRAGRARRPTGRVGVVHAGWRGLAAGVIDAAVDAHAGARRRARPRRARPVHPRRAATSSAPPTSTAVADALGDGVRATTTWGTPALDLPAAVRAALPAAGVDRRRRRRRVHRVQPTATSPTGPGRDARALATRRVARAVTRRADDRRRRRARSATGSPPPAATRAPSRSWRSPRASAPTPSRPRVGAGPRRHRRELRPGAGRPRRRHASATPAPRWHFIGRLQRNKVRRSRRSSPCGSPSTGRRSAPRSPGGRRAPRCSCR